MGMGICHTWECSGTAHLGSQCSCQDLVTRRHGLWACEDGTSCLVLHVLVACTLVELRQAFRRSKPQRCRVARVLSVGWFDHIRNLDTSLIVFLRGIYTGLWPSEGGIVYGLFSKEASYVGKASVHRTHCPGLAARLTIRIRCLYRPGLKDASKPRYRLLRRRLWGFRFFPLTVFPTISQTLASEALAISMKALMGNARDAAEERRLFLKGEKAKVFAPSLTAVELDRAKEATMGKYLVLFCCQRSSFQTSSRASQFSFQVRWCWTFLFPLFTQLRYGKNMRIVGLKGHSVCLIPVGWGYSWRIVRKVRTVRTFRGSGCRGGLGGRLHLFCTGHANRFPKFLSFPPDSVVLHPEIWNISCGFILYY